MFIRSRSRTLCAFHLFKFFTLILITLIFMGENGNLVQCMEEEGGYGPKRAKAKGRRSCSSRSLVIDMSGFQGESQLPEVVIPMENLDYDPKLLKKTDPSQAQKQVEIIIDFLELCDDSDNFDETLKKYEFDNLSSGEELNTIQGLKEYLLCKSCEAFSDEPTLTGYLQSLLKQNNGLISLSEKLLTQHRLLLKLLDLKNEGDKKLLQSIKAEVTGIKEQVTELPGKFQQTLQPDQESGKFKPVNTISNKYKTHIAFLLGVTMSAIVFSGYYLGFCLGGA